eukprot:gnl/TRDRNA2_/TRDRNA2_141398_c0_seq1.p1 gnl/TRDRNA2_/TRDRNA2_141398_c0~~gnl/TRDRNA2_/TRDRNA2_141398_c0_seq1.p1  ORF type:complete len:273 (+),score=39.51 gnl/TRDRNA2_/TRDRNA2_141398_c0_seq1:195-1013(+)
MPEQFSYARPHDFFPGRLQPGAKCPYLCESLWRATEEQRCELVAEIAGTNGLDVDLNAWNSLGETVLFVAARFPCANVCATLMLAAADPSCRARDGRRAVDHVPVVELARLRDKAKWRQAHAVQTLLQLGSALDNLDVDGGHESVLEALEAVPEPTRRQFCSRFGVVTAPDLRVEPEEVFRVPDCAQSLFTKEVLRQAESLGAEAVAALTLLRQAAGRTPARRRLAFRSLLRDYHPDKFATDAVAQNRAAEVFCYLQGLREMFLGNCPDGKS